MYISLRSFTKDNVKWPNSTLSGEQTTPQPIFWFNVRFVPYSISRYFWEWEANLTILGYRDIRRYNISSFFHRLCPRCSRPWFLKLFNLLHRCRPQTNRQQESCTHKYSSVFQFHRDDLESKSVTSNSTEYEVCNEFFYVPLTQIVDASEREQILRVRYLGKPADRVCEGSDASVNTPKRVTSGRW